MAAKRTIATILADAERIGRELHGDLARPAATRLTREAWQAEAEKLAGGAEALADARARVERRPFLAALLARVARDWRGARTIDGPAPVHAVTHLDRETGAIEALHEGIGPELAGAVVGLLVAEDPDSEWGECTRRGAAVERVRELQAELVRLDQELLAIIPDGLALELAYLHTADGREVDWHGPAPAIHAANVLSLGLQVRRAA